MSGDDIELDVTNKAITIGHTEYNVTNTETSSDLAFGSEFKVTETIDTGSNGHITSLVEKNYKLPSLPSAASIGTYTKEEIDDLIEALQHTLNGMNPMSYKGVVNADIALPSTNVSIGDTYMVAELGYYGLPEQ
jgi:hypothetical protein